MKWHTVEMLRTNAQVVVIDSDAFDATWEALMDELERVRYERDELRDALASSHDACAVYRAAEVRAEREACARLAPEAERDCGLPGCTDAHSTSAQCMAALILARGNK